MRAVAVDVLTLAWRAVGRGIGLGAAIGLVVMLTCTTAASARAIRNYLATHDPLQHAQRLSKLLGHWFPADVVASIGSLPDLVLIVGLTLLALDPLLAAGYAAKLDPGASRASVRTAAGLLATAAVTLFALVTAAAITCVLVPGMLTAARLLQFSSMAALAVLASLPSAAVAAVARSACPARIGAYVAFLAALGVRYGLPLLSSDHEQLQWFVPRTYELALLSSSTQKAATAAALCVGWSLSLLGLAAVVTRLASRLGRRVPAPRRAASTIEPASGAKVS